MEERVLYRSGGNETVDWEKGLTFVVHLVQSEDSLYACLDIYTISYSTTIWIVYLAVTKIRLPKCRHDHTISSPLVAS